MCSKPQLHRSEGPRRSGGGRITRRQRKLGFDLRYVEELVAGTDVAQLAWQERQAALRVECVTRGRCGLARPRCPRASGPPQGKWLLVF